MSYVMDDYEKDAKEEWEKQERRDKRILGYVEKIRGPKFIKDLMEFNEDCMVNCEYHFSKTPGGQWQR